MLDHHICIDKCRCQYSHINVLTPDNAPDLPKTFTETFLLSKKIRAILAQSH